MFYLIYHLNIFFGVCNFFRYSFIIYTFVLYSFSISFNRSSWSTILSISYFALWKSIPKSLNYLVFMLRSPAFNSEKHFIISSKFMPSNSGSSTLISHSMVLNHHFHPLQINPSQSTQHMSPLISPHSVIAQGKIKCYPYNFYV